MARRGALGRELEGGRRTQTRTRTARATGEAGRQRRRCVTRMNGMPGRYRRPTRNCKEDQRHVKQAKHHAGTHRAGTMLIHPRQFLIPTHPLSVMLRSVCRIGSGRRLSAPGRMRWVQRAESELPTEPRAAALSTKYSVSDAIAPGRGTARPGREPGRGRPVPSRSEQLG